MRRLKVLTWHVHGAYLYYLSQAAHDFFVPVKPGYPPGYAGRCGTIPWPNNLHEVPAEQVRNLELDCVLFQSSANYLTDQHEILSAVQRKLPQVYLEHDPPREHPTDTRHVAADSDVLLVHVTHFNRLMWDSGSTKTCVIDHGVRVPPGVRYSGELARGLVVVNNLQKRGRRLGADVFEQVRQCVPLDLVGMDAQSSGGLGEIQHRDLPAFAARYRFFFNPIRYTSLGLAVCEAMTIGMPIIGLATTEMATTVQNGVSGYVDTDVDRLVEHMQRLLSDADEAGRLGQAARRYARQRFHIGRFARDWSAAFAAAVRIREQGPVHGDCLCGTLP
jgi:glycosyltransferase involved in cell wall biosynthesis